MFGQNWLNAGLGGIQTSHIWRAHLEGNISEVPSKIGDWSVEVAGAQALIEKRWVWGLVGWELPSEPF